MQKLLYSKILIISLVCLFFIVPISGQNIRNINVDNGLSNNQTYSIAQDWKGFIWVTNKKGVDRFDGVNVVNYNLPVKINAFMTTIVLTDRKKNLWAYTFQGDIFYFSYIENRFVHYIKTEKQIHYVSFDESNKLWIATENEFLVCDNKQTKLRLEKTFYTIYPIQYNNLLVADNNKVYKYDTKTNALTFLTELNCYGLNRKLHNIISLYFDPQNQDIWIGTVSFGLFNYNLKTGQLVDVSSKNTEFPLIPIRKIIPFNSNSICFSTDGSGIFFLNKNNFKITRQIKEDANEFNTIKGNGVFDLFKDDDDVLYSVSYTGGISIINNQKSNFNIIRQEKNNSNSLSNDVVSSIIEDRDGDLWFSTPNGVNLWEREKNKWRLFKYSIYDQQLNMFLTLTEDKHSGNILAGSFSRGIMIINKQKGVVGYLSPKDFQKEIGTNFIAKIYVDEKGNIWSGGYFGELSCYQVQKQDFYYFDIKSAEAIEPLTADLILVATSEDGVFTVNKNNFQTQKIYLFQGTKKKDQHRVRAIANNKSTYEVWCGTDGEGLVCWNYKNGKLSYLSEKDGLPSNYIQSLVFDNKGLLWGGSDNGLFCLNTKNHDVITYTRKDGLSDNSFLRQSCVLTRNNELLFGTNSGVNKFSTDVSTTGSKDIRLYIDVFSIFNQPVVANQKNSPLSDDIDNTHKIELKWNQNSFSFSFGCVDLQNIKQIQYKWKLQGLEDAWNNSLVRTYANYTNIEPGNYEFILQAINKPDKKVLAVKKINVVVTPPFWATFWARIIFFLIIVVSARGIYIYFKKKKIQRYSDEKVDFFTRTAHDIKTPLSLVMAPINELRKSSEFNDKDKYLINLAVSNIEKLTTVVNQLMDFQKSDSLKSQLVVSRFNVIELTRNKVEVFSLLAKKQDIDIVFAPEISELFEWMDVEKFERILDNLISNAIKYTGTGGNVMINIKSNEEKWKIAIKDSGIGISIKDQSKLFKHFYRGENAVNSTISGSGVGLLLTKNYVALHNGKIEFKSAPNVGTEFVLTFNHGKDHYGKKVFVSENDLSKSQAASTLLQQKHFHKIEKDFSSHKVRLMLIEDNEELLNFMQVALSELFTVRTACNGKEALDMMSDYDPDLVISDVQMPEMDGLTFSSKLKSNFETSHIPIILLSALTQKDQIISGIESGVDDYITKPFDMDLLIAKIQTILKNRQLVRERFIDKITQNADIKVEIANERDREFIEKVLLYIQNNLEQPNLKKNTLAREMAVSQTLLFSKLKHLTGEAPSDLIRIIRLKRAMELLQTTNNSILDIAMMTGFNDSKYFSTVFKKHYGKSPSEVNK